MFFRKCRPLLCLLRRHRVFRAGRRPPRPSEGAGAGPCHVGGTGQVSASVRSAVERVGVAARCVSWACSPVGQEEPSASGADGLAGTRARVTLAGALTVALQLFPGGEHLCFERRRAWSCFLCFDGFSLRLSVGRGRAGPMDAWTLGGGWTSGLRARTPACAGLDARAPPVSHRLYRWPGAGFLPPPHSPHLARVLLRAFLHRFSGFCSKTPGCWRLVRAGEVEEGGLFVDDPLAVLPEARINTKAKARKPACGARPPPRPGSLPLPALCSRRWGGKVLDARVFYS